MKSPEFKAWVLCVLLVGFGLGGTRAAGVFLEGARLRTPAGGPPPAGFQVVVMSDEGPTLSLLEDIPENGTFYFTPDMEEEISRALSSDGKVRVRTSDHSRSNRELDVVLEVWGDEGGTRYGYHASESGVVPFGYARLDGGLLGKALWAGAKWFALALLLIPLGLLGRGGRTTFQT